MLLNEDYFDKIEITDDDISSPDISSSDSDTTEYANPEEWFADMKSKYGHFLRIRIEESDIVHKDYIWKSKVPHLLRNLQYVLDVYDIDYSQPTIQDYTGTYCDDNYRACNFIDLHNYKLISFKKSLADFKRSSDYLYIVMFFNLPKVRSYKEICQFAGSIIKPILANDDYKAFVPNFKIQSIDLTYEVLIHGFYTLEYNFMNYQNIPDEVINLINIFYPEKYSETIRQELLDSKENLTDVVFRCFRK